MNPDPPDFEEVHEDLIRDEADATVTLDGDDEG